MFIMEALISLKRRLKKSESKGNRIIGALYPLKIETD